VCLGACAGPVTPTALTETVAARSYTGSLHVEPFAIFFRGRKNEVQSVRVWEPGFRGSYRAVNRCTGVTVTLQRGTVHHESIWQVRPVARVHESCVVQFVGSGGRRGTGNLDVRVHR
ncbi:MAG TPA: hypothetical protein VEW74_08440, partial [Candidatus Nitrosotalea sp.]|nr:hypothetical protein [Candidatus Nitrosotalea sp.]